MVAPDPQSRIYSSAEGKSLAASRLKASQEQPPPPPPAGWVREVKQRKDSTRKDIVYRKQDSNSADGSAFCLRSASEAARWVLSNPACGLTIDAFDFVVRKGDKLTAVGFSGKFGDSDDEVTLEGASEQAAVFSLGALRGSGDSSSGTGNGGSSSKGGIGGIKTERSAAAVQGALQPVHKKPKKMWAVAADLAAALTPTSSSSSQAALGRGGIKGTSAAFSASFNTALGSTPTAAVGDGSPAAHAAAAGAAAGTDDGGGDSRSFSGSGGGGLGSRMGGATGAKGERVGDFEGGGGAGGAEQMKRERIEKEIIHFWNSFAY